MRDGWYLTLLPSKQILKGGRRIIFEFTLESWNNEFTSLTCCTWLVTWVSFCMPSSVACSECFMALDNCVWVWINPCGSLPSQDLLWFCEFMVVFYESQEKMWWWALWTGMCLLISWYNGFPLKQTNPSSCFAALSSSGVLYIEMGAGQRGFFSVCSVLALAQHREFT